MHHGIGLNGYFRIHSASTKRDKSTSCVKQPLIIDDTWTDKLAVVKSISKILQSTQEKSIGNFSFLLVGCCQLIEFTLRESFTTSISGHRANGIRRDVFCFVLKPRFTTEVAKSLDFASFAHLWRSLLVQLCTVSTRCLWRKSKTSSNVKSTIRTRFDLNGDLPVSLKFQKHHFNSFHPTEKKMK